MQIKEADQADYIFIAELFRKLNITWPQYPMSVEELLKADLRNKSILSKRYVVLESGKPVGYGSIRQMSPYNQRTQYKIIILTESDYCRKGIGTSLFNHILTENKIGSDAVLSADAYSVYPELLGFYQKSGFHDNWQETPVIVDINNVDLTGLTTMTAQIREQGFEIFALESAQACSERNRELYNLYNKIYETIPSEDDYVYEAPSFENWEQDHILADDVVFDSWFYITYQGEYIGLKEVFFNEAKTELLGGLMGVLPEFRKQGLARLMQLKTIDYAQSLDHKYLRSCTAVSNYPMQKLFQDLGYKQLYVWHQMYKF